MSRAHDYLIEALKNPGAKPSDSVADTDKKNGSERLSASAALALAAELRDRGLREARPASPGEAGGSGAERRMAGGIGNKRVDVTWATEQGGLMLAISIKSINFKDKKTGNYQKNLINRRNDMAMEAVTLHRRFPYAVLAGVFFLPEDASADGTEKRKSTMDNAHDSFRLFTGRSDPAGREEQFERFFFVRYSLEGQAPGYEIFEAGKPDAVISIDKMFEELLNLVVERNSDSYELVGATLKKRKGG